MHRSIPELTQHLTSPAWLASYAARQAHKVYDSVSPSDFSVLYRKIRPITMCSNARLRGLYRAVNHAVYDPIPGDIVECGTARGGSAALMGLMLRRGTSRKKIYVCDTFEGLPAPTKEDPEFAKSWIGGCYGSLEDVKRSFKGLGIDGEAVFLKGLFQDTLPGPIKQIAVLHLDGDWHDSTKVCLEQLYDRVVPGGIIQFDDYGYWAGSKQAVDEFFKARGIVPSLTKIDYNGRQLVKPQ